MKQFEVHVNPEPKEFCLAFTDRWVKVGGHAITIGNYQFSAVPINNNLLISEVTSGAKVIELPVPDKIQSFEETMFYLETIVTIKLIQLIESANQKDPNRLDKQIDQLRKRSLELLGDKPPTEKLNADFFKSDISEILN